MSDPTIENLLDAAMDSGKLIGRGESCKGAHYAVVEHNGRYFTGIYTSDNYEYVCGAEEITKDDIKKYIGA
jgi:hypothetical protein